MKMVQISEQALETMKAMVEKLDADNKMLLEALKQLENLRWGTVKENHSDQMLHGTKAIGEDSPNAKLTNEQAKEIRNSPLSSTKLSRLYGVHRTCVQKIKRGETWVHIE